MNTFVVFLNFYRTDVSKSFSTFIKDIAAAKSTDLILDQCSGIELKTEYSFDMTPVVAALRNNQYFTR